MSVIAQPNSLCIDRLLEALSLLGDVKITPTFMINLVEQVTLTRQDVERFVCFDHVGYCRNDLLRSDRFQLSLIGWLPGQYSPIHDHAGSTCVFRVIAGVGEEQVFEVVSSTGQVRPTKRHRLTRGTLSWAEDNEIHRVGNPTRTTPFVTLHFYSPPPAMNLYSGLENVHV